MLGPIPAPMAKRAGRYRAQLLIQSPQRPALHQLLSQLRQHIDQRTISRSVRWSLDVGPQEMFNIKSVLRIRYRHTSQEKSHQ